jgi:hypothetical protein
MLNYIGRINSFQDLSSDKVLTESDIGFADVDESNRISIVHNNLHIQ